MPYALAGHGVSVGALLLLVTAMLLFGVGLVSDQIAHLRREWLER
jgi:amino acid permease